jgi:K+-sensing histidine kinase KdpD
MSADLEPPALDAPAGFESDIATVEAIAAIPAILEVVTRVTGMGFAAVARVTPERWVCLASHDQIGFGLKAGGELDVETTICREVRQARGPVVIDHVAEDEFYCKHHTPAMYGFQSYISMPIFLKDGSFYGTLCAIDPKPARLKDSGVVGMFRLFAELIAVHLDSAMRLADAEASLLDAEAAAELREQFIAVLGHDLRNPLAAIEAGTRLLEKMPIDVKTRSIVGMMQQSAARMSALIEDVADLARGRLGGGIPLSVSSEPVAVTLLQVVEEMRAAHPGRIIEAEFAIAQPVRHDRQRIARLLSNLLGNALAYGAQETPVKVHASTNGQFELSVTNAGEPISAATMRRMFAPYARGADRSDHQGLGLGLYIVSEIARAHGGTIAAVSTAEETRFTFRMPL